MRLEHEAVCGDVLGRAGEGKEFDQNILHGDLFFNLKQWKIMAFVCLETRVQYTW